jgi:hypothetical protein
LKSEPVSDIITSIQQVGGMLHRVCPARCARIIGVSSNLILIEISPFLSHLFRYTVTPFFSSSSLVRLSILALASASPVPQPIVFPKSENPFPARKTARRSVEVLLDT